MKINLHNIGDKIEESSTENELSVSLNSFQIATGIQTKIVHIKKTLFKKNLVHFFWNSQKMEVLKGYGQLKTIKNFHSTAHALDYHQNTSFIKNRSEIQLGDSVFYYKKLTYNSESFVFGYVTGFSKKKDVESIEITRISLDSKIDGKPIKLILNDDSPVFLLSHGYNDRYEQLAPLNNKLKIKYKYQIDSLEFILGNVKLLHIIKNKYNKRNVPLGELAFKDIHKSMFGDIYDWAGEYRSHEVVVGDRERETVHHDEIKQFMRNVFNRTNKSRLSKIKTIDELSILLTHLHSELAWIHPFEDGNGRAIRSYMFLISFLLGFKMDITSFTGSKKRKSLYHYAVRKAIYDRNFKYLHKIIRHSLSDLKSNRNPQPS
ncbi:Fic family protein [Providencia hangzhouensis]|uniref:Fic family protein n=1 Tax=Providencia hangzhouensis TaxID=3031799 RepID=UPI0034DCDC4E